MRPGDYARHLARCSMERMRKADAAGDPVTAGMFRASAWLYAEIGWAQDELARVAVHV